MSNGENNQKAKEPRGCLMSVIDMLVRGFLRLLGLGGRAARATIIPPDTKFQEYVDSWVAERLGAWLNQTRSEIVPDQARRVLMGESERFPEAAQLIRETLIDAKVTFSQRDGSQYLEVEAYLSPRQMNGKQPQILRYKAEREITWQEIPNEVREHLIRTREPVTLGYAIPEK